jgi:hypothetical protein
VNQYHVGALRHAVERVGDRVLPPLAPGDHPQFVPGFSDVVERAALDH